MLYGPQLKSEKIEQKFNKEDLKNEIKSKIKDWQILENVPYCDLLFIKNFAVDVVIRSNAQSFQPYESVEKKTFQKIIAVELKDKKEESTMNMGILRKFTSLQIECDNLQKLMYVLNDQI